MHVTEMTTYTVAPLIFRIIFYTRGFYTFAGLKKRVAEETPFS